MNGDHVSIIFAARIERVLTVHALGVADVSVEHGAGHQAPIGVLEISDFIGDVILRRDVRPVGLVIRRNGTRLSRRGSGRRTSGKGKGGCGCQGAFHGEPSCHVHSVPSDGILPAQGRQHAHVCQRKVCFRQEKAACCAATRRCCRSHLAAAGKKKRSPPMRASPDFSMRTGLNLP